MSDQDPVRVSAEDGKRLLGDGYQYIDVRSEPEYDAGHVVGAHNVPLYVAGARGLAPNEAFIACMEALYAKDAKLLVGCAVGKRSLAAARALIAAGFSRVVDMRPGTAGVKDAFGQVTEKGWFALGYRTELTTEGGSWAERRAAAGL
jgi:YD repeat-containing protein